MGATAVPGEIQLTSAISWTLPSVQVRDTARDTHVLYRASEEGLVIFADAVRHKVTPDEMQDPPDASSAENTAVSKAPAQDKEADRLRSTSSDPVLVERFVVLVTMVLVFFLCVYMITVPQRQRRAVNIGADSLRHDGAGQDSGTTKTPHRVGMPEMLSASDNSSNSSGALHALNDRAAAKSRSNGKLPLV
ncbi:hypothetical protein V5799_025169 [Amblyomma americanum]|uniref:Uncharacterized protein n=1 Tax=Amblyomma americanum TaxID=6943 RepID=A0AAQ4EA29_AMBAM